MFTNGLKKEKVAKRFEVSCLATGHSFVFESDAIFRTGSSLFIDFYSFKRKLVCGFFYFKVITNPVDYALFKDATRYVREELMMSDFSTYSISHL